MTPEAADYLAKARQALHEARAVFEINLLEAAGRAAYLAAQAFLFDRTGKVAKTHSGVRSEFARLAKEEPGVDGAFPAFLAQAYLLKEVADYAMGPDATIPLERAAAAIETASRFIDCIAGLISRSAYRADD